jgi:hypothetical protein
MDQTAPPHRGVLWHNRERSERQIWIAVSVYVLVAIVKKRLNFSASLYEMLQILSLTMFERMSINQLLARQPQASDERISLNQLSLFE